jgi:hypothetical protein
MMDDRDEQQFNEWLQGAAKSYNEPRPTPREELWARVAAERERRRSEKHVIVLRPWFRWGLGIAAVLAVGVGIGRWTARSAPRGPVVAGPSGGVAQGIAYQVAATQYLSRAETFLTEFRADSRQGGLDPRFANQAGELLTHTRLMLDSPAADNPRVRALLEELELVLVQIAHLGVQPSRRDDLDLITQGMEQRGVLTKLRSAIPAGPATLGESFRIAQTQGVL